MRTSSQGNHHIHHPLYRPKWLLSTPEETEAGPAAGICNKKLELVQFLSDHDVTIWLTNETYLVPGQDFHMPN